MAKKNFSGSINLPVECLSTIIDTNNKNILISVNDAIKYFNGKNNETEEEAKGIQTLNTIATIDEEYTELNIPFDSINVEHDVFMINSFKRKPIVKTNPVKFYSISVEFTNGICKDLIVPSYVKFYSYFTGSWVPVEHVRARHILMDYTGSMVKSSDATLLPDFNMTDYYNIKVSYSLDEMYITSDNKPINCTCNFYLNGILANVSYNNFQMTEFEVDEED